VLTRSFPAVRLCLEKSVSRRQRTCRFLLKSHRRAEGQEEEILKPRRVSVLMNVSAGKVDGDRRDRAKEDVESAFARHAIRADLQFHCGGELHTAAKRALQQAMDGKCDAVVVIGGDGSIHAVASALSESGVPLGVIPAGTLNHFAKDLKIPLAIDDAVAVIAKGNVRPVDVGVVNGRSFINNSSIGIYPYLVLDRERQRRRKKWSKWPAMAWALLRAVRHFPLRRLSIQGEGSTVTVRSPCVFVGNNEYRLTGASLGSRDTLDGGHLCVYVAKQQSMGGLFWLAARCVLGLLDQSRDLRLVKCSSVDIDSRNRKLLVAFDGEVEAIRSPLHYRIKPKALRVFVP
jgi:diacylglycerol kinase family enzyme